MLSRELYTGSYFDKTSKSKFSLIRDLLSVIRLGGLGLGLYGITKSKLPARFVDTVDSMLEAGSEASANALTAVQKKYEKVRGNMTEPPEEKVLSKWQRKAKEHFEDNALAYTGGGLAGAATLGSLLRKAKNDIQERGEEVSLASMANQLNSYRNTTIGRVHQISPEVEVLTDNLGVPLVGKIYTAAANRLVQANEGASEVIDNTANMYDKITGNNYGLDEISRAEDILHKAKAFGRTIGKGVDTLTSTAPNIAAISQGLGQEDIGKEVADAIGVVEDVKNRANNSMDASKNIWNILTTGEKDTPQQKPDELKVDIEALEKESSSMLSKDLYTGEYFNKSAAGKGDVLRSLLMALGIGGLGAGLGYGGYRVGQGMTDAGKSTENAARNLGLAAALSTAIGTLGGRVADYVGDNMDLARVIGPYALDAGKEKLEQHSPEGVLDSFTNLFVGGKDTSSPSPKPQITSSLPKPYESSVAKAYTPTYDLTYSSKLELPAFNDSSMAKKVEDEYIAPSEKRQGVKK